MKPAPVVRPFRLLRWFGAISAVVIALTALTLTWVISDFLTARMIQREAELTADSVNSLLLAEGSMPYFRQAADPELRERFESSTYHFVHLPDVVRVIVYNTDRTVLWSTDPGLIGRQYLGNDELETAIAGRLYVDGERISKESRAKPEHAGLPALADFVIETYIPLREVEDGPVVGVVELYKAPVALTAAIQAGKRQVALVAGLCALSLYLSLYGLVRRADGVMREQQLRLRAVETQALIGEMASSVAHNIRNPLASIRSTAELTIESTDPQAARAALDIIAEVDRISLRITELLHMAHVGPGELRRVLLEPLVRSCVAEHRDAYAKRRQQIGLDTGPQDAATLADPLLLKQAMHSILSNASEAMPAGGRCTLTIRERGDWWTLSIDDDGPGMTPAIRDRVFAAFFTTKPRGLGIGLPMARRIVEGMGGSLELDSEAGRGTTVTMALPKA